MKISRRSFLKGMSASAALSSLHVLGVASRASANTGPGGPILVLVNLAGTKILSAIQPASGGADAFSFPVPNDPATAGLLSYAQGYILGGAGFELCNRLEVVVGD